MPVCRFSLTKRWAAIAVLCGALTGAAQADWPNFLGPRHDGISQEKGLKTTWSGTIPQVWETEIGAGFSAFACVGDRVYTAGTKDKQQVIYCLHADTGKVLWEHAFEEEYPERQGGDGPRATPTIDENRLYMLGARGKLVCLNAENGAEIWSTQFSHMPQWGYSGSVLIEGDMAVAAGGKSDGGLVAFDKVSGKVRWRTGEDPVGYATPYPFTFEGTRYLVGFNGNSAMIVEAGDGRLVYHLPWKTDWEVNAAAPIFHDGYLFLGSGYQTGCALLKLRKEGDKLAANEVWRSKVLLNKFQSAILHEGSLYASDQKDLICVDFLTGKEHWRKRRIPNGTLVLAEGWLYLLTEKGELQIAKAGTGGFEPVTQTQILDGRCWTVPVLYRGKLYARNLEKAICLNLKD